MRSKVTIRIPRESGGFPETIKILEIFRDFGWELTEIAQLGDDEEQKQKIYRERAEKLFADMPEIAQEEKEHVVFFGFFAGDQTKFVVTRRVEGQLTIRLLQKELGNLQSSTEKTVRRLLDAKIGDAHFKINRGIQIYEKEHAHIIINSCYAIM